MIKKILKENLFVIILMVLTIICFVIVKNSKINDNIVDFDNKIINNFKYLRYDKFTSLLKIITNFGDWYTPIFIIVCIFIFFKNRWYFYIISCSYAFAGVMSFLTKLLILRDRPIEALIKIPSSYSFPSGHTLTSIVFYITLCYLLSSKIKGIFRPIVLFITLLLVTLIALSRVYLGVHYFSDVIGGLILGIMCELLIINVVSRNFNDKI